MLEERKEVEAGGRVGWKLWTLGRNCIVGECEGVQFEYLFDLLVAECGFRVCPRGGAL